MGLEFPSGSIWTLQKAIRIYRGMKNSAQEILLGAGQQDNPQKSWTLASEAASGQFEGTSPVLRAQQLIPSMSVKLPPNPEGNTRDHNRPRQEHLSLFRTLPHKPFPSLENPGQTRGRHWGERVTRNRRQKRPQLQLQVPCLRYY